MHIRKTTTSKRADGTRYETYRIVESDRIDGKPTKRTLLSIGGSFALDKSHWPALSKRIREIVYGTPSLFPPSEKIEKYAQDFAAKIIEKRTAAAQKAVAKSSEKHIEVVENSADLSQLRTVGGEHVALHAAQTLSLPGILKGVGFTEKQVSMALAIIVARMVKPGSENATWDWLTNDSSLGELLNVDFSKKSVMRLHRISDDLIGNQEAIEAALFDGIRTLFSLDEAIVLFDLTNTFFQGSAVKNPKAKRGRSKEKRSDAPLLTLALVLDSSGFIKRSRVFAGNVHEASTVQDMLRELESAEAPEVPRDLLVTLEPPKKPLVVMDRGTATEEVLDWLVSCNYRYVVMSREKIRTFDMERAQTIELSQKNELKIYSEPSKIKSEVRLYCYSQGRAAKENGITERFTQRFEDALRKLNEGLSKPRTDKKKESILRRIGRIQEQSKGISQHYSITVTDNAGTKAPDKPLLATSVHFEKNPVQGSIATHPGVYCIRTNAFEFGAEAVWRIYAMLNDLESVFRSLKSELGLRPVYHQTEERSDGHLFITVLAYQCVQVIRKTLKSRGINKSWQTIRQELSSHQRATISFLQRDGGAVHIRKASRPNARHLAIYNALGIDHRPGGSTQARFLE